MKYIVMLFHSIPEDLKIFLFNEEEHDLELIRQCNGCFINRTDEDSFPQNVRDLLIKLSDDTESPIYDSLRKIHPEPVPIPACDIVICGFLL